MGMSNRTLAHEFYYRGVPFGKSRKSGNMSYRGDTALSYHTAVARVIGNGNSRPRTSDGDSGILVLAYQFDGSGLTSTTCRHCNELRAASPYAKVVYVPVKYGHEVIDPGTTKELIKDQLARLTLNINRMSECEEFLGLMSAVKTLRNSQWGDWFSYGFEIAEATMASLDEVRKECDERKRKSAARKAAETRKFLESYDDPEKFIWLVERVFSNAYVTGPEALDYATRARAKSTMNAAKYAYVWPAGDVVRTSRSCTVPLREAVVMLKAWRAGKDLRGARIGAYTVLKCEGSEVKIGCHLIPRKNLDALYAVLVGKDE